MPNAQERLKECENNFKKSYGENLERVMALKGNSSSEAVLYVRLHLLQGIVDLNFLLLSTFHCVKILCSEKKFLNPQILKTHLWVIFKLKKKTSFAMIQNPKLMFFRLFLLKLQRLCLILKKENFVSFLQNIA